MSTAAVAKGGAYRWWRNLQAVLTVLCGLFLVIGLVLQREDAGYIASLFGSYFAVKSMLQSLRERQLDVNFLMVLAAAGAIAVGHPLDAAGLLFLFSLSNTLETYALAKTRSAIEGLVKLRPSEAVVVRDSGDARVRVEEVQVGDLVRLTPFEQVPVDGEVLQGESFVDQSAMTGESDPVSRGPGDLVLCGTQNLDGMLLIRATARVGDSTLAKIVELVRDAQENKASGERISAWFGQRYTFMVFAAFGLSLLVRGILGHDMAAAFYSSLVLLVALSPCALVISTPATTLSALAWAARNGFLIRGGQYIEALGKIDTVAMDKTGTLTTGKPRLVEICVCTPAAVGARGCQEEEACWHGGAMSPGAQELLRLAAAAEQYSTHPIAQAIVSSARQNGVDVPEATDQKVIPGFGIQAEVDGARVQIGRRKFFQNLPPTFETKVEGIAAAGMTVAILQSGDSYAALGLRDAPRTEAQSTLAELRQLGVDRVAVLTGDTDQTAQAVAAEIGLTEVHAGLLPNDKTVIISDMVREGRLVMMVGDGVNDAPSLASAHVGVAMGGLGSDVALNAADVVLMNDRLEGIPQLLRLGRRTNAIIRANLILGASMIVGLAISLLFLPLPLWIAVLGHEGSTVLVILNGLRLLRGA
jgi:Zn2+/Cd2+-exporting ATPase